MKIDIIFVYYISRIGSLVGGAVAIDLAVRQKYKNRIAGLIVENTFTSLAQLLQEYTRVWYFRPLRLLFSCLRVLSKVSTRRTCQVNYMRRKVSSHSLIIAVWFLVLF